MSTFSYIIMNMGHKYSEHQLCVNLQPKIVANSLLLFEWLAVLRNPWVFLKVNNSDLFLKLSVFSLSTCA